MLGHSFILGTQMDHLDKLIEQGFMALVASGVGLGVKFLSDLRKSVDKLHKSVAVVVTQSAQHTKDIDRLDDRMGRNEDRTVKVEEKVFRLDERVSHLERPKHGR